MEVIELLRACAQRHITVKKAFSAFGVSNTRAMRKPLKQHTEEIEFACIMNWITRKMRSPKPVTVRLRVENTTYEIKFRYIRGQLRVNIPKVVSQDKTFIMYDWDERDTLIMLTAAKINASVQRANAKEIQARQGAEETEELGETSLTLDKLLADILEKRKHLTKNQNCIVYYVKKKRNSVSNRIN